jgi:hypothetical protein
MAEPAVDASPASPRFITRNPVAVAREQLYGTGGRSVVFSYASPEALKAAKMESLEGKIQAHLKTMKTVSVDLLGE